MKCKAHPLDYSAGVCASCLRERLLAVIAAQSAAADPQPSPSATPPVPNRRSVDTDFIFPPAGRPHHHPRFFSTPQVVPVSTRNKSPGSFSLFSSLFRHPRSEEPDRNQPSSGAGSWFSSLIPGKSKKKTRFAPVPEAKKPAPGRRVACRNRGMSPEDDSGEEDCTSESGYSTESTSGMPRTAAPTPMRKHVPSRGTAGFGVCLSPLVWGSPNCHRSQQVGDGGSGAIGFSAELRSTVKTHHPHHHDRRHHRPVEALRPNRSRKLADFGRFR